MTASTWHPKEGPTLSVRRRRWTRTRRKIEQARSSGAGNGVRELVDLTDLKLVYSCGGTRSRREIAAMLSLEQSRVTLLGFTSPASFLAAWARLFAADGGRTERVSAGENVLVIYDLDDVDVLASVLLPLITESGEYRAQNAVELLGKRFARFAVVLAGWTGPSHILIDRLVTDRGTVPPIRLGVSRLE